MNSAITMGRKLKIGGGTNAEIENKYWDNNDGENQDYEENYTDNQDELDFKNGEENQNPQ